MPFYIDLKRNTQEWVGDEKPATHVGNKKTQRKNLVARTEGTIRSTARAIKMQNEGKFSEEELAQAIKDNAKDIQISPEELRELAEEYIRFEEEKAEGSEQEQSPIS